MNEIIANEKDINDEICWNHCKYQNPLFLAKDLIRATQAKNQQLVKNVDDGLIDLRNAIIKKEIPENENPNFKREQIGKGRPADLAKHVIILIPEQILQKLPIALVQLKAGNTSKNLLNEMRQILYYLHGEKEITTKMYNNVMNSINI